MNDGNNPEMDEDRQSAKVEEKQTTESPEEKRTSKEVLEVKVSATSTGKRKSGTDDRKERKSGSVVKEKISAEQLPKQKSNTSIEQTKSAAVVKEKRKSVGIEKHASDTGTDKRISTAVKEKKISVTETLKTYPDPDLDVEDKLKLADMEKSKSSVGDIKRSSMKISEINRLKSGEYEKEGDERSKPTLEFRTSALDIEKDNRHTSMDRQEGSESETDSTYVPSIDFDTDPRVQWIKKSILNYMGLEDEELFYSMLEEKGAKQNLEDLLTATIPPTETSAKNRVMYVSKITIEEHIEVEEEVVEWSKCFLYCLAKSIIDTIRKILIK